MQGPAENGNGRVLLLNTIQFPRESGSVAVCVPGRDTGEAARTFVLYESEQPRGSSGLGCIRISAGSHGLLRCVL